MDGEEERRSAGLVCKEPGTARLRNDSNWILLATDIDCTLSKRDDLVKQIIQQPSETKWFPNQNFAF